MSKSTSVRTLGRGRLFRRWLVLVLLSGLGLQLYFVARVAMMRYVDPQSTAFERSQIVQILTSNQNFRWRQQWMPAARIHTSLSRAVIASEDDLFASHDGVQWQAIEKAWTRNEKAQARSADLFHDLAEGECALTSHEVRNATFELSLYGRWWHGPRHIAAQASVRTSRANEAVTFPVDHWDEAHAVVHPASPSSNPE